MLAVGVSDEASTSLRVLACAADEPKAIKSEIIAEHLGYFFQGFTGWIGISNLRALGILTVGVELLVVAFSPLLYLQVLPDRLGHAFQTRRALWCYPMTVYTVADEGW